MLCGTVSNQLGQKKGAHGMQPLYHRTKSDSYPNKEKYIL